MELYVLIPLGFAGLFLILEALILIRIFTIFKKSQNDTVENFGNKINPYLYATSILSVMMAICMVFVVIMR